MKSSRHRCYKLVGLEEKPGERRVVIAVEPGCSILCVLQGDLLTGSDVYDTRKHARSQQLPRPLSVNTRKLQRRLSDQEKGST